MFNHGLNFPESNTTYAPPPLINSGMNVNNFMSLNNLPGILPGYWRTRFTWNTPRILENKVNPEYSQDTGEQGLPGILPVYWRTRFTWNRLTGYRRTVYLEYSHNTGEQG